MKNLIEIPAIVGLDKTEMDKIKGGFFRCQGCGGVIEDNGAISWDHACYVPIDLDDEL